MGHPRDWYSGGGPAARLEGCGEGVDGEGEDGEEDCEMHFEWFDCGDGIGVLGDGAYCRRVR